MAGAKIYNNNIRFAKTNDHAIIKNVYARSRLKVKEGKGMTLGVFSMFGSYKLRKGRDLRVFLSHSKPSIISIF